MAILQDKTFKHYISQSTISANESNELHSPKYVFSPVGSDHYFLQFGDDDVLTTQELKHTLVSPPVFRFD